MNREITLQDKEDIVIAQEYRIRVNPPRQSSFRVVALIYYQLLGQEESSSNNSNRNYVVGANDEPCYMNGSICAERAALVQLRFLPIKSITKVVITTDSPQPIYPGFLCREFMSSHLALDPETVPIITAGSLCRDPCCRLNIGKTMIDNTFASAPGINHESSALASLSETASAFNACLGQGKTFHQWNIVKTSLTALYPYPSPYTRLDANECVELGPILSKKYSDQQIIAQSQLPPQASHLIAKATEAANAANDRYQLHPIQYAAAVLFDDGTIQTACQRKALEYGCSLDAVTQLGTYMEEKLDTNKKNNSDLGTSRPKLLVQTDQFGVIHAPFATARSYLSEFGFGDTKVLISQSCQQMVDDVQILQISVCDLAPSAPDIGALFVQ
jgi:cytidine deaminase